MAQIRRSELKPNHSSSSDDEEEEVHTSESEEVSDSDAEEIQKEMPKKAPIASAQSTKKPQSPNPSSSGSEETGSDSDSDSDSDSPPEKPKVKDPNAVDPNIKPIASKRMGKVDEESHPDNKSTKKPVSKSKTSQAPPPPPPKTGKRALPAVATSSEKDSKKAKKSTAAEEDQKKQLFQRLWSEEDEIAILQGMIDYNEKKGADPVSDMSAFLDFIKKSLHVDVNKAQLVDKVRRLKKKYVNNASKEKEGKDRVFTKNHEQKGYELSKLIWGIDGKNNLSEKNGNFKGNAASTSTAVALSKANGADMEKEVSAKEIVKKVDVSRFVQYIGVNPIMEEEIIKGGLELVEGSKKEELEEKWNKLKVQELELYVMRLDMVREQAARVLESLKSSTN